MRPTLGFPSYFDGDTDKWQSFLFEWEGDPHASRSFPNATSTNDWDAYVTVGIGPITARPAIVLSSETVGFSRGRQLAGFQYLQTPPVPSSAADNPILSVSLGVAGATEDATPLSRLEPNAAHVEPSVIYSGSIAFATGKASSFQIFDYRAVIYWRDADGVYISTSEGPTSTASWGGGNSLGAYRANRAPARITAQSPDGAAFASLAVEVMGFAGEALPYDLTLLADNAMLVIGPEVPGYFDGSTPNDSSFTYEWEGDPDSSESIRTGEEPFDGPSPIVDPSCPPPPPAPRPPQPSIGCEENVEEWRRVWFVIPEEEVYEWGAVVPTLTLEAGDEDVTAMRVTVYENPNGIPPQDFEEDQPYVSRWHVSYLPAGASMTIDGTTESVSVTQASGYVQDAGYLVTGPGQGPLSWPRLECGGEYLVSIETPLGDDPDNVSLSLSLTREFG